MIFDEIAGTHIIIWQISEMYERQALAQSKGGKKSKGDGDDGFW